MTDLFDLEALPDPLVDSDVDCRGLPFMPLETTKLRESELVAISSGDEFKAAVLLWAKSWSEIPAGSLPDDDRILMKASGYFGAHFQRIKYGALRGWIKCSDGRFYHPLICDLAENASNRRKKRSAAANSRWSAERKKTVGKSAKAPKASKAAASANVNANAMVGTDTVKGTVNLRESRANPKADSERENPATWTSLEYRGDDLLTVIEAEKIGEVRKDPEGRKGEVWFMAKGVLRVLGQMTEAEAGKAVGEISGRHGLDIDEIAALAVSTFDFKPNNPRAYMASQAAKIAGRRI